MQIFPIDAVRQRFPALSLPAGGKPRVHLDNPAGTQVPEAVAAAVARTLVECNANLGGYFPTTQAAGAIVEQAHRDAALLFGAQNWREIVIGPSMTALTFLVARSLGRTLAPGGEIVVTQMDHDGNVAPWLAMAADHGLTVRRVAFDRETWRIEPEALQAVLSANTRLVALGYASNLTGSINDVAALTRLAKAAGALVYVDAVQFAPHGLIDVAALGCDFLAASAYKFFGPHLGLLWAREELLRALPAYKVRPLKDELPWRWEQGTPQLELQAGLSAAIEYLLWLGEAVGGGTAPRDRMAAAWSAATAWEAGLALRLIEGLRRLDGVTIHGITNPNRIGFRVPTVSFTHAQIAPATIARTLAQQGICVWSGNNYALEVVRQLGIAEESGVLRIGIAHYNTAAEIDATLEAIGAALAAGR
jgi:cysteine desulfurase family protein (TIGR01976 family)